MQQDRDKALTLDGARLQYGRQSRVFLAVDCDEFLVPEGKAPWTVEGFKAELLQKHFSEKALGSVEEVQLLRKSVAGVPSEKETPWVMNLTDKVEHSRNFYKLSRCLQEGMYFSQNAYVFMFLAILVSCLSNFSCCGVKGMATAASCQ